MLRIELISSVSENRLFISIELILIQEGVCGINVTSNLDIRIRLAVVVLILYSISPIVRKRVESSFSLAKR